MIEIDIPKDIRKYEAKLIGPLTTRQTVCAILAGGLGLGVYFLLDSLAQDVRFFIIMILALPILLCGWYKPYGMHFEKFVQTAFITTVVAPANRPYVTESCFKKILEDNDNGSNNSNKNNKNSKKNKKTKASKEYIAYD